MDLEQIVKLMESSTSEAEWNANCKKVKTACGGYPDFWNAAIIQSGIANKTMAKFGGSADIKIAAFVRKPIQNLYGRPASMPFLQNGESVVGIYNQGLGEKERVCNSLADMQCLYDSYASGMALTLKWAIESHS